MKWIVNETDWIATHRNHGNKIFIILRKRARSASQTRDINEWENEQKKNRRNRMEKRTSKHFWTQYPYDEFHIVVNVIWTISESRPTKYWRNQREKKGRQSNELHTDNRQNGKKKANRYDQIQLNEHHITTKIT